MSASTDESPAPLLPPEINDMEHEILSDSDIDFSKDDDQKDPTYIPSTSKKSAIMHYYESILAAEEEAFKLDMKTKPADFLAPYLVPYKNRSLTYKESCAAFNACLSDLKTRFVGLLNDLQGQYEDLTAEAKSLNRFLEKFEDQFDNFSYEKLVEQANVIALHKRMVQQRLTLTHEESQAKYELVRSSLLKDVRLNFIESPSEDFV